MTETESHTPDLDALFAEARQTRPDPVPDLVARVLADAAQVQHGFAAQPTTAPAEAGIWAQLMGLLGGWSGLGGLAAACAAGVWLGVAPPQALPDPVLWLQGLSQTSEFDLIGGGELGLVLAEEG